MLLSIIQTINSYLSDYVLIILLIGVGLWYSLKTGFVQLRFFREGMARTFGQLSLSGKKHDAGMATIKEPGL